MSNKIRIKRRLKGSTETSLPVLETGEFAYDEIKGKLYIGESDGGTVNAKEIAGSGFIIPTVTGIIDTLIGSSSAIVRTTGNQSISGVKTFASGILVSTTGTNRGEGYDFVGIDGNGIYVPSGTIRTQDLRVDGWLTIGTKLDILAAAEIISRGTVTYTSDKFVFNSGAGYFTSGLYVGPTGSPTGVSLSGHKHDWTDINNFCTGVASCVSTALNGGSGIVLNYNESSGLYIDIGQGDGINVSDNYLSVDTTVIRNSGTQSISGTKTFADGPATNVNIQTPINGTGSLNFYDGSSHIGVIKWDGANHNMVFDSTIFGANFDFNKTIRYKVPTTGTVATSIPVFTGNSNPAASVQAITARSLSDFKTDLNLNSVTNHIQVKQTTGGTEVGYIPTWNSTSGELLGSGYGVSTNLVTNSGSSYIPRADAVVSYVNTAIGNGIAANDAMIFKGVINCSTNPNYPAADRGWTYKISATGRIGGNSGPIVEVNDTLICTTDGVPGGVYDTDLGGGSGTIGSNWVILQTNIVDSNILVTGPSSSHSGNIAIFNGTTGKAITGSKIYQSGNNIGIDIENPDQLLTVNGIIRAAEILTGGLFVGTPYGGVPSLNVDVNSTTTNNRLLIDNTNGFISLYDTLSLGGGTNSVYIGPDSATKSPVSKLDVSGVITASGGNSNNWNTAYGWGNHSSVGYVQKGTSTSGYLPLWSGSSILADSLIYQSGNNIGIGTKTPSGILHVFGTGYFTNIKFLDDGDFVSPAPLSHGHASSDILTSIFNDFGALDDLVNSISTHGGGSAGQLLRKDPSNTYYEFTSSLSGITIDCGAF